MTVAGSTARTRRLGHRLQPARTPPTGSLPGLSRRKRITFAIVANLVLLPAWFLVAEVGFQVFWKPRYWIHTSRLGVASGQTEAGKKWWPETLYRVDGSEFRTEFRTDARGYRARPTPMPPASAHPYRIAMVGDSFTEAMQVPYESSFCARLETLLNASHPSRPRVCLNFGVSATGLFDYWHRIVHDVLPNDPPEALILCLYPGNDFQPTLPADAFDAEGRPLRDYFRPASTIHHLIAWINLHSKFGCFAQRALLSYDAASKRPDPRLNNWWGDPARAAQLDTDPQVARTRALFRAIVAECRKSGTRLGILVVGPVANYSAKDGKSPIATILGQWGIDVPVIDTAIVARARPQWASVVFPFDGHLNDSGHQLVTNEAIGPLQVLLDDTATADLRP